MKYTQTVFKYAGELTVSEVGDLMEEVEKLKVQRDALLEALRKAQE